MPIMPCVSEKKKGFKYWETWNCYTYEEGNKTSEENAREQAIKQWQAIEISRLKKYKITIKK